MKSAKRLPRAIAFVLVLSLACTRDTQRPRVQGQRAALQPVAAQMCKTPTGGLVISPRHVALFPTHSTLSELRLLCDRGQAVLYDAVGWQAPAEQFPFVGARITAVESKAEGDGRLQQTGTPDLWAAEGDSLRLEDGQLVPRTLGELRRRYGPAISDDNVDPSADDFDGYSAVSCRFSYVYFKLGFRGRGTIPDSARIVSLEMWVPPPSMKQLCQQ